MLRVQADFADSRGDLRRVVDDDLFRLRLAQIAEFLEHLLRRLEIQRRLIVPHPKAVRRLNDRAEFSVLRVEEVHVARRADRNAQLLAQPDDFSVKVAKLFLVLRHASRSINALPIGWNFEVVVEPRNTLELRVVFAVRNGAEQLARLQAEPTMMPFRYFCKISRGVCGLRLK